MTIRPMLAGTLKEDLSKLRYPLFVSPKLDGIRALIVNGEPRTRRMLQIPNRSIRSLLTDPSLDGLDGELICGPAHSPSAFVDTTSAVMTQQGEPPVTFWVFDIWTSPQPYRVRMADLPQRSLMLQHVKVRPLKQFLVRNEEELLRMEEKFLIKGFEGAMLRDPEGLYKFGRSSVKEGALVKLKRFMDSEAVITGVIEQVHNANEATINELGYTKRSSHKANRIPKGTLGAFACRDVKTGVEFEVASGLNDLQRAAFWKEPPIGQILKYRYQQAGVKNKPRFPTFLGIRRD